jgi:XTP/dITP diphosphohydrolase
MHRKQESFNSIKKIINFEKKYQIMKLIFATNNKHKLLEVQALINSFELMSLSDINCLEDIPETANTLEGNAIIKANFVTKNYGKDAFADDSGLEVAALNNEPGVFSARYAGGHGNAEKNMDKLLQNLQGKTNRKARFRAFIALNLNNQQHLFEGVCNGEILHEKRGEGGFGYDPIFKPKGFDQSFAEMDSKQKNAISHRGICVEKLVAFLKEIRK